MSSNNDESIATKSGRIPRLDTRTRRAERSDLRKIAHLEIITPCVIADISKTGARLIIEETTLLPEKFVIVLRAGLRRWCQLKWREADRVGVEFIPDISTC